jgi:molybdopterin/thiamine biosynthesis adenylyltransferase/rhodanese-related sulfurtransferase
MLPDLDKAELKRYNRHIILPEIGLIGQQKLKAAKVLVIGAGGLGCPVSLYLTAAGIGTIGLVDMDVVDESNLQRQVLYTIEDIGKPKVDMAKKHLIAQNPHIKINTYFESLTKENALLIFEDYDIIVDGSDNFATRYLVNDACVLTDKPLVYGSIFKFEGQVTVFNYKNGPNYRCLYPTPPKSGSVPSCSEIGVLGVLPGMIGTMQANEVIKMVTGIGEPLSGKLWILDALTMQTQILEYDKDADNPINGTNPTIKALVDYDAFCNFENSKNTEMIKEITPAELKAKLDNKEDFQLIDVREDYEYDICNLGADLIPLGNILSESDKISKDKTVVIHCKSGRRSATAILELQNRFGFENLYNLKGGILGYAAEVDSSLATY